MNHKPATVLEALLRTNDLASMIDVWHPADKVLEGLLNLLERVASEYRRRFGPRVVFSTEELDAEAKRNPHKIKAFLQALGISNSPEMMVMVWRILEGSRVREVNLAYTERQRFLLDVCLAPTGDGEDALEHYRSTDINDATLLRHFGVAIMNGQPLFEGFYPLNVSEDFSSPAETPV